MNLNIRVTGKKTILENIKITDIKGEIKMMVVIEVQTNLTRKENQVINIIRRDRTAIQRIITKIDHDKEVEKR